MKNSKKIIISIIAVVCLILIVLVFSFYSGKSKRQRQTELDAVVNLQKNSDITAQIASKSFVWKDATGKCLVDIYYPEISGTGNTVVESKINKTIKEKFSELESRFQVRDKNNKPTDPETLYKTDCNSYYGNIVNYEIKLNQEGVLSLRYDGANDYTEDNNSLNFSLITGNVLSLSDILNTDPSSVRGLNNLLKGNLASDPDMPPVSAMNNSSVDTLPFYLYPTKIVFFNIFTSYVYYDKEVPINYSEIKDLIKNQSIQKVANGEHKINLHTNITGYTLTVSTSTISVIKNGGVLQTIPLYEGALVALEDGDTGPFIELSDVAISDMDVNFDGFNDLALLTGIGYGGVNMFYDFYVFNPQKGIFIKDKVLTNISNPTLDVKSKTITSEWRSGPQHFTAKYIFTGKNYTKSEAIPD